MKPTIHILEEQDIERILDGTHRILEEIGIEVRGPRLRRRLLERGLRPDPATGRLLFPRQVVQEALSVAPSRFTLYSRDGQPHATIGGNQVHFVPGSSALYILDPHTNQVRPARTADFVDYVRLADSLPHLSYLATAFSTEDVDQQVADAWRLHLCLLHSRKPVVSGAFTEHGVPLMAEMMALFRRDRADLRARPMAIFTITATGHFRYGEDSCQNLLDCVEWGIPVEIVPVTLMGLIAPVTLMEATTFHTADVLAGLVMAQLIRPGTAVLFGGAPAAFHMQHTTSPMAAIEAMHVTAAYVAVGKALGLPTQTYLALSESRQVDAQAGAETFAGALMAVLAGVNSVSGPGMLDYLRTFSLAKLVLDDELCGQALHLLREQPAASENTAVALARELLREGNLLTAEHTLRHWPRQLHLPGAVIDRMTGNQYLRPARSSRLESQSLPERAEAEVQRRLAAYRPIETDPADRGDPSAEREMQRLISASLGSGQVLPELPTRTIRDSPPDSSRGRRRTRRR